TQVSMLEIGVSGANVFAGIGNPDSNGDGKFDATDVPADSGAVGITLTNVSLGLALMTQLGTATPTNYFALSAQGTASLVGITGLTLTGSLQVQVNSATDFNGANAPVVDFTQMPGGKLSVPTGPSPAPAVDLDFATRLLRVSGSVTIGIDGFAYVDGSFAFEKRDPVPVTLEDLNGVKSGQADILLIGASHARAFFGLGGPSWVNAGA